MQMACPVLTSVRTANIPAETAPQSTFHYRNFLHSGPGSKDPGPAFLDIKQNHNSPTDTTTGAKSNFHMNCAM
jgi:hypothetical protein